MAGVSIDEKRQVGNRNLCVRDIVQELKVDGRPFKSIGTYQNYCGWMNNASWLLSCMETEGHKDSPTERRFLKHAHDLLWKPLHAAMALNPNDYGSMTNFSDDVKQIET